MTRCLGSSSRVPCILSFRQFTKDLPDYFPGQPKSAVPLSQFTTDKVPCSVKQLVSGTIIIHNFQKYSNILPPFTTEQAFGSEQPPQTGCGSFRFYPPHCCQASLAGTSSLLRIHLPPHTASVRLEFPLDFTYPKEGTVQGFPG